MKVAICTLHEERYNISYDDYDYLYKIIPASSFSEVSDEEFRNFQEYVQEYNSEVTSNKRYILLTHDPTLAEFDEIKNQVIKYVEKTRIEKAKRDKERAKNEKLRKEREEAKKRKKLEQLKKELGEA